ncbi:hypothetical protein HFO56_39510 [Rhizobium laguerreae]|uniref:hypothetical protein n=1 Tax=Rhizobium laguerreae TaxID=1076926 RepID=UPI001C9266BB|nr:hypothetical protein [Rhizobium laguerreae]MBY3158389.1 hypothetical protein [Rhizobium laguerreae]
MRNTSPSEYLAEVKNRLGLVKHLSAFEGGYDQAAELRKTFPYLAHYTSGQTMFPARVKSGDGYGIESFIRFLASQCDGAIARDNRGFDQGDAPEGHRLAAKLGSAARLALTSSEREWAIERSKKYREQLTSRYGVAYQAVMEELKFVFPPAPDEQDRFVQHLRYNESSRSISFSLPSVADAMTQSALMSEVWALVRAANVSLAPPLSDMAAKLRRNWDKNRAAMTFLQTERCARDLVDILEKLGYTKDERIDAALDCNATAYIRVRPETGPGYSGKRLVGFLYHIARNDALHTEIVDLYYRFGRHDVRAVDAVNLSKKHRHPVQRFFVGDAVIDDLEEILMRHGVQNYDTARIALDDPKRSAFQYPALSQGYVQTRTPSLAARGM